MLGFIIFAANAPTVIQQNTDYAFTMVIVAAVFLVLSGNLFIVDAIKWQVVLIILEYFKHSVRVLNCFYCDKYNETHDSKCFSCTCICATSAHHH